jgi:hypothetical protein
VTCVYCAVRTGLLCVTQVNYHVQVSVVCACIFCGKVVFRQTRKAQEDITVYVPLFVFLQTYCKANIQPRDRDKGEWDVWNTKILQVGALTEVERSLHCGVIYFQTVIGFNGTCVGWGEVGGSPASNYIFHFNIIPLTATRNVQLMFPNPIWTSITDRNYCFCDKVLNWLH